LIAAHETAVREALEEAEKYSATRVRLAGLNENRTTGNWILAAYTHDTSRELAPQLHTHAVAANLTYDGVEGRWKALQAAGLYERRSYLTEVYRNALARQVRTLGYEIENSRDVRGRDKGFDLAGFSHDLLDKYSQRSAQRDAAIQEFTRERGRAPTDNEVAVLVRETRAGYDRRRPRDRMNRHTANKPRQREPREPDDYSRQPLTACDCVRRSPILANRALGTVRHLHGRCLTGHDSVNGLRRPEISSSKAV
jgi:conjugative relaxase-like TrwC/TraI family protein